MTIASIIVTLIVVGVVLYLVRLIPMDAAIQKIISALVILAVVLWVCEGLGLFASLGHPIRFR